ncbi:ABC transporter substrate-binding protein [Streptomyces sp. NPDC001675]
MKPARTIAVAGVLTSTLAACGGHSGPGTSPGGGTPVNGQTFTMALGADPGSLDPHFTSQSSALQVDRFLYDSLVNIDERGAVVPGLAAAWRSTTTRVTYTLRKNITCSDGSPLTAGDVAANVNFVADPDNGSTRLGVFVPPGAKAVADDRAGTVTVTTPTPNSFLDRTVGSLHIVCRKGMKDRSALRRGASGTGMFKIAESVAGDRYTLTRRKDYAWGPGDWKTDRQGLPDKVVLRIVSNGTTAANQLIAREVNAAQLAGADQQRLRQMNLFRREVLAPLGELWFNQAKGRPGADVRVRRALTQALDLGELGKVLTGGTGRPATGLVAPGLGPCSQDTVRGTLPAFDAGAAARALDAAGWRTGPGGTRVKDGEKLRLSLYYLTSLGPSMQASAELVQKRWKSAGAQVDLKGVSDAEHGKLVLGGQDAWGATIMPLGVALPTEAVPFLSGPTPPGGNNFAAIDNPAYTAGVAAASAIAGTAGCGAWADAEKHLFKDLDLVPFVNSATPTYAQGATFELSQGTVTPGSIRMVH